ncbi:MAG: multiheme c-type cytochrome [Candidatus Aquicultorales bacterium]
MRRVTLSLFVFSIGILLTLSVASCSGTKTGGAKKTKAIAAKDFDSPDGCKLCHSKIAEQWAESMHANAWKDPLYQVVYQDLSEKTDGAADSFCAGCHAPVGVLSNEIPPGDGSKVSPISGRGVQCDFCHTVSAVKGAGNFSVVSTPGEFKLGPLTDPWIPSHAFHKSRYSKLHTTSGFCGACHKVNHPVNKDLRIEDTFTEWLESEYAKKGIVCQDCHMTPGPGVTKPNPGQPAIDGPQRKHVYTHYFVGGNAAVPKALGLTSRQTLAEEQLKGTAQLEIFSISLKPGEKSDIKVTVRNTGAGHYLPTGATEFREMWLDVTVVDASGGLLFHSGMNEDGTLDKKAVVYKTVLADKDGKPTHDLWKASRILSDKRIPPMGSVEETILFDLPAEVQENVTVTVILKYRSISNELADEFMGDGKFLPPVVDMASITRTF